MSNAEPDWNQLSSEVGSMRRALKFLSVLMWLAPIKFLWFLGFKAPHFEQVFNDMLGGEGFPPSTRIVLNLSNFIGGNLHWLLIPIFGGFVAFLVFTIKARGSIWYFYVGLALLFSSWAGLAWSEHALWLPLHRIITRIDGF